MSDLGGEKRPWGRYDVLHVEGPLDFQVKRISVNPNSRLSLQRHSRRDEVWTVVSGKGVAVVDDTVLNVEPGDVVKIKCGQRHRMQNIGNKVLVFVEVQLGSYLGEDDIERLADDYHRT